MSTVPVVYSGPYCSHGSWPKANSSFKWPQVLTCILLYLLYSFCVQYDQSFTWSIYFTGLQTKTWEDSKPIGFLWISCVLRHRDAWCDQVLTNNPENLSRPCKQQWLSFLGHFSALTLLTNPPQSRHRSQGEKTIPSLYSGMSPSACHSVAIWFSWEEVGLWAIPDKSIGWWDIQHISPTVLGSLLRGSWNLRKPIGPYKHETV